MKLSDEQLSAMANPTPGEWHWEQTRDMARELLAARKVVEAARKIPNSLAFEAKERGMPLSSKRLGNLIRAVVEHDAALTALDEATK